MSSLSSKEKNALPFFWLIWFWKFFFLHSHLKHLRCNNILNVLDCKGSGTDSLAGEPFLPHSMATQVRGTVKTTVTHGAGY